VESAGGAPRGHVRVVLVAKHDGTDPPLLLSKAIAGSVLCRALSARLKSHGSCQKYPLLKPLRLPGSSGNSSFAPAMMCNTGQVGRRSRGGGPEGAAARSIARSAPGYRYSAAVDRTYYSTEVPVRVPTLL
jgi:hypothetical protein